MNGIADTGFVVAFLNRRDSHHRWAVRLAGQINAPLATCEAVLAEAAVEAKAAVPLEQEALRLLVKVLQEETELAPVAAKAAVVVVLVL